jgi:type IV pilus assembly protein PilC
MTKLRERGMTPVEVKRSSAGLKMQINLRPGHVKLKSLAVFSRQFATMVNSGLPILRALAILSDRTESTELKKILTQVRVHVEPVLLPGVAKIIGFRQDVVYEREVA